MKGKRKTTQGHKAIIEAHNNSKNGLKFGVLKSERKPNDTPLFKINNQESIKF